MLGRDTYFVESFNTLKIYQNERIAFDSEQCKGGAFLETCPGMKMWSKNSHQFYIKVIQNPLVGMSCLCAIGFINDKIIYYNL